MPGDAVTHRLSPAFLAEFCSGAITPESMSELRVSVYSQRRAMWLAVTTKAADHPAVSGFLAELKQSWTIVEELERHAPEVVESVLMHPSTGVWMVRALRALLGHGDLDEIHYLRCIAAAAAIRAGHPCALAVPAIRGVVPLPTVGHVRIPGEAALSFVDLHTSAESATVHISDDVAPISFRCGEASPGFFPTQYHHSAARGLELLVEIDDTSPYREFADPQGPDLLSTAGWTRWHELFDSTWDMLTEQHRGYAEELSAGLRTVAPVRGAKGFAGSSSNAAFGAVALGSKGSAAALAEVLIHELQHSKLNALLELVTLSHAGPEQRWYAPWRPDPRPLTGLLHGIYAFVSVVEFWSRQRDHISDADLAQEGAFAFALRRIQVRTAVDALAAAPELTERGRELVTGVSRRLAACEAAPVPGDLAEIVAVLENDHWVTWRLHHVLPDAEYIDKLADAWRTNQSAPLHMVPDHVVPFHRPETSPTRSTLLRSKVLDPKRYAELAATATEADLAFSSGDHDTAKTQYLHRIRQAPDDTHAWAGLALTAESQGLQSMPEVVLALHNRLPDRPDPLDLAAWLAG